jgi:type IV secretory pathway VirD2 relaxase
MLIFGHAMKNTSISKRLLTSRIQKTNRIQTRAQLETGAKLQKNALKLYPQKYRSHF